MSSTSSIQKTKIIDVAKHGHVLGPRTLGKKIANDLLEDIQNEPNTVFVFDMKDMNSLSSGFCYDLFGTLHSILGDEFTQRIKISFGNNPNKNILLSIIFRAISSHVRA